jgi:hypothetical protein
MKEEQMTTTAKEENEVIRIKRKKIGGRGSGLPNPVFGSARV